MNKFTKSEMQSGQQLAETILAKGHPSDADSSAVRSLRMINSSSFRGVLSRVLEEVVVKSCQSKAATYIAKYEHDAKLIITNLIVVAFQWEWLGLGTRVSKGSYLDKLGLSRRRIEAIIKALLECGYAVKGRGGYLHHGNPSKSRSTQYYPTEKLLMLGAEMLYETVGDFDDYEPYEWDDDERWDPNEGQNESARVLRRQNTPRGPSYEQEIESFFTRGPRTRCSLGARA